MRRASVLAALAAAVFLFIHERNGRKAQTSFAQMTITPISSSGHTYGAAISPDGKWLAYISDEEGKSGIWVRQLGTGSTAQVVAPSIGNFKGMTFSPDGNYLYFVKGEPGTGLIEALSSSLTRWNAARIDRRRGQSSNILAGRKADRFRAAIEYRGNFELAGSQGGRLGGACHCRTAASHFHFRRRAPHGRRTGNGLR